MDGRWVEGAESQSDFRASIQPAKDKDYDKLQALAEGRRVESAVRIYTRTQLAVAGDTDSNGDIVIYRGDRYLVTAGSDWNMGMRGVNHYRYLAVRQKLSSEEGA
ncbi:phage collar protein [Xanthomonas retroflexus]|uniref:phage collar protein n=1 Tax=Stenotrophomonas indicatrix TaxID=2045451 RepID=UPI001BAFD541